MDNKNKTTREQHDEQNEQVEEQLDLEIKRVKSLKTNVKGGTSSWGGRSDPAAELLTDGCPPQPLPFPQRDEP